MGKLTQVSLGWRYASPKSYCIAEVYLGGTLVFEGAFYSIQQQDTEVVRPMLDDITDVLKKYAKDQEKFKLQLKFEVDV